MADTHRADLGVDIPPMTLKGPLQQDVTNEFAVIGRMLVLDGTRLLELGCGGAEKTRMIAKKSGVAEIVAAEVDAIAHQKNLTIDDLPTVTFKSFGAEDIPEEDESFDAVLMFKSLHHVPLDRLDDALLEIARVLKPGGLAYFSEPVFDGPFNEVMRLFHDEESVRAAAFAALRRAVEKQILMLKEEYFFRNVIRLESWAQYEKGILGVTHTDHDLSPELLAEVKKRFLSHEGEQGFVFEIPNRVDLLQKPI